jgi:hypothetical protein
MSRGPPPRREPGTRCGRRRRRRVRRHAEIPCASGQFLS